MLARILLIHQMIILRFIMRYTEPVHIQVLAVALLLQPQRFRFIRMVPTFLSAMKDLPMA